ncbi:MAG: undecaprenyl-diphosphate phosphatase [Saprospiraceae bacterium]
MAKYFMGTDFHKDEPYNVYYSTYCYNAYYCFCIQERDSDLFQGVFIKGCTREKAFLGKIVISMIPAGLVGFFLNDFIESFFDGKIVFVSLMLLVTGILLLLSEYLHKKDKDVSFKDSFIIGIIEL